jgi:hypothetical protein
MKTQVLVIWAKEVLAVVLVVISLGIIFAPHYLIWERFGFEPFSFATKMADKVISVVVVLLLIGGAIWSHLDARTECLLQKRLHSQETDSGD